MVVIRKLERNSCVSVLTSDVVPCRELAYQIAEQFRVLGKPLGLRDCIIVGGMGKTKMLLEE